MPRNLIQLNVFVSSPTELETERKLTIKAIEDVTQSTGSILGIVLKPLTWEDDIVPGVGSDVQEVISSQVDSSYDIYVGLLGSYFGTPTAKAGSGTEEEFLHAYQLYRDNPEKIRILVYFKNTSRDIFKIDLDQFQKVKSFKEKLTGLGVLYGTFSDVEDLYKSLMAHLNSLLEKQWAGSAWKVLSEAPRKDTTSESPSEICLTVIKDSTVIASVEEPTDEDGFFELLASGMRSAQQITSTLESMTSDSTSFQEAVAIRATDLQTSSANSQKTINAEAFDGMADDMSRYDETLREKVPVLDAALDETLSNLARLSRLITSEVPQGRVALAEILPSFKGMAASVRQSKDVIVGLQASINTAPPMTKKLRRAKKSLVEAIEALIASVTVFGVKADVVVNEIEEALAIE